MSNMDNIFIDRIDRGEYETGINFGNLSNYNIDNSYKLDDNYFESNYKLDKYKLESTDNYDKYKMENSGQKFDDIDAYKMKYSRYNIEPVSGVDSYKMDDGRKYKDEDENNYEVVNSNVSTNVGGYGSTTGQNIPMIGYKLDNKTTGLNENKIENGFEGIADNRDFINYYQPYQYYGGYQGAMVNHVANFPMAGSNFNHANMNMDGLNNANLNSINLEGMVRENSTIDNESIEDIDGNNQIPTLPDGNVHDMANARMSSAIDMDENEADIRPPLNRSDPIYTSISGLKWKSKSKKWVVRWDNPMTNRRVYKYFSGNRYGFLGAHKRAKFYLEFLNASVGKINTTTPGNPFCRRTEGPPKGKTNKSLIRKYYSSSYVQYPDYINAGYVLPGNQNQMPSYVANTGENGEISNPVNSNLDYFNYYYSGVDKQNNLEAGSSIDNPWYISRKFNNF